MESTANRAIAIVGVGAILPDAPNAPAFWKNVKSGRYSITDVTHDRWDPDFYYDADPAAPDKTYSKIGGWVREYTWDPMKWKLPIPPRVADAMDQAQKWAVACTREALEDYGYPERPLDLDRTAVILGNAMGGERHYLTSFRVFFPEYAHQLAETESFTQLPAAVQRDITNQLHDRMAQHLPPVTEDSMPGELANCMAGRIANLYNFHGPNYTCDAACASAMAAISSAAEGLIQKHYDVVVTGGVDRNMGAPTFVKFCKIGALSATGTRPYAQGADGFVMGEGGAIFLLKRLADAERDGDKIYAVLRGIGGSSDGKGKGITAPNPVGQKICVERAWQNAGLALATATMIEGHGTSTRVGDVVEAQSIAEVMGNANLPVHSVALGSVKSNIGHLKGAAGAAGMLKATFALRDKMLPPSLHCEHPSPDIDFAHSPLFVNTELKPWMIPADGVRRAGVSAFGFGGTNFHMVMEEHVPGRLNGNGKRSVSVPAAPSAPTEVIMQANSVSASLVSAESVRKAPLRGALVIGGQSEVDLIERLREVQKEAQSGHAPAAVAPADADLQARERIAIDYGDAAELATKSAAVLKAFTSNQPAFWKALRAQGIFRGKGPAPKVAFLYTGQGSQYVNMMKTICALEPIVAQTFAEADGIMTPLIGKPLTDFMFVDSTDAAAVAKAENDLRQTAITQPAVITSDIAMTRLLAAYGIRPDMTMGHSVGEYGALVAAGALPFEDALEAVSARGREMTRVSVADNGKMAAVFAPIGKVEEMLKSINGYVVIANVNSTGQSVIGGGTRAVEQAVEIFLKAGYNVVELPVSHAFHTSIVAPASEPLRQMLQRLHLRSPQIPVVANVNGEFYPTGQEAAPKIVDMLAQQVAAPVQFVKGLHTLYDAGVRVFIEVGPKKALQGFAEDVLGANGDVVSLFTNHPKLADAAAFNQALCGLYAAGLGGQPVETLVQVTAKQEVLANATARVEAPVPVATEAPGSKSIRPAAPANGDRYVELGRYFADVLERGWELYRKEQPKRHLEPIAITGAALGLPGTEHIFDDSNVARILRGEQLIGLIPERLRRAMVDKHVTRLVKSDNGGPTFESITDVADVIKLAGRGGAFDLCDEFGVSTERLAALDRSTQLAIASGLEAMRDAGIPLVMRYKTTTKGTQLPDRWGLPDELRDDTGVIFASAFPGCDAFADYLSGYYADQSRREQLALLEELFAQAEAKNGHSPLGQEIHQRMENLRAALEKEPYVFDRRFLFRVLSMGHSQFAEFIGARGPNTQVNAACASTSQAISLAEDWIRAGRCRRVIILSADDATSDNLMEWIGAGFLASGAAATDDVVEDAAIPFDRRRHGLIVGMGAAALVVESAEAARERGIQPICEVLSAVTANSAFHGTRLDVQHIGQMMEDLVARAETLHGISRRDIAPRTVFVSHETYTPARGGSASAEIFALRRVFGDMAGQIVISNTKGFTGHAMATGIEEVVAVKALETGCVPPVANFKEIDPELGALNLSKGGSYPVEYALRLGAGFGSQISMALLRWVKTPDGVRRSPKALGYAYRIADTAAWQNWLSRISGHPEAELEVIKRTLRVRDQGPMARTPASAETSRATPASVPTVTAPPAVQPTPAVALKPTPLEAIDEVKAVAVIKDVPKPVAHPEAPATIPEPPIAQAQAKQVKKPSTPDDSVKETILALVVAKTGYPAEMLDPDLDLEADLGVDTVKQAEIFAAIREKYSIPRDENRKLRDYPTLAHVIRFVFEKRPDLAADVEPARAPKADVAAVNTAVVESAEPVVTPGTTTPTESVKDRILALVVEKTGYPPEMLDLDLDLEADLGVDTVKQAEMFAAIREIYNIPRDENRKLRDYPTLAHVIRFVLENRPDLAETATPVSTNAAVDVEPEGTAAPAPASATSVPATPVTGPDTDAVKNRILSLVVEKTGYPPEMLDLDLDLEADLGVDTVKQAEMFAAIREIYNIPRDENRKLRDYPTLAHVIRFVFEQRPDLAVAAAPAPAVETRTVAVKSRGSEKTSAPAAAAESVESIKDTVLQIVAEKTGYPPEMLDLDLDLEADLGIDTVKQAEMFAAVRAAYNIPRDENLKLRDFPTLSHVIQFAQAGLAKLLQAAGVTAPATAATPSDTAVSTQPRKARTAVASFDATNLVPRRVPLPVLRPPLTICKPTGVTLAPGTRVVIASDGGGVAQALAEQLAEKGVEVLRFTSLTEPSLLLRQLETWLAAGPVAGVYWLPALDDEGPLSQMSIAAWRASLQVRVKALYTTMRKLFDQIASPGKFLIAATCLGGQHGYDEAGAVAPMGGAVAGFTKTYKRERAEALVKVVDFEPGVNPAAVARLLLEETVRDPGAVEIGYKNGLRWTIGLQEQPADDGRSGLTLNEETVFLVTGAAGSIVSAITADLAVASGGTFYLLDLVPEPEANNSDLERFASDREALKRDLFARIQARGERATPVLVEKELAALERAHAALSAINAIRNAGGTAHYFSLNLADADGVTNVLEQVRKQSGRIDVLLHAAGLERSHFLPDKDPREFDLVFDVKADGWFNLLHAIGDMPLGATVAFSSVAGRFGNGGQADYSAANDLLCKYTSSFRSTRPQTRGIVIDWTAWGGIGMATRGSIPKMMEFAGIDMLSPEAGIPLIRRELTMGGACGEVVIAQRLGSLLNEWDATGGLDTAALSAANEELVARGPMAGTITGMGIYSGLTMETTLDPAAQPFLYDHRIDGTPVLPGVMGIEAFAEAAACVHPGWHIEAIEEVNFLAPFKFYKEEPRTLFIQATISPSGERLVADCRLIGRRKLPNQPELQETVHFTARVRVGRMPVPEVRAAVPRLSAEAIVDAAHLYRVYFHGPAYQVLDRVWWDGQHMVGEMAAGLPGNHNPADLPTLMAPRLIELCFQTAGVWEMGTSSRMGLPQHLEQVSWLRSPKLAEGRLYAIVTPHPETGTFDAEVIDASGNCYVRMGGYQTVALPDGLDAEWLKAVQTVVSPEPVGAH